jgi:hypothetical protein
VQSPVEYAERKHIRFDNKVEQCIAVEIKEADFEEDDEYALNGSDESSDDGLVMMQKSRKVRPVQPRVASRRSSDAESKIIAKLPSTTLKDRADAPRAPDSPSHSLLSGVPWRPGKLSPSPSIQTLRPSNPSRNFLVREYEDDDDEGDEEEEEFDPLWNPEDPYSQVMSDKLDDVEELQGSYEEERQGGLRKTSSGMFMPYEEGDEVALGGIVGRVLDTVNTARDIAHVIWNVGFRR